MYELTFMFAVQNQNELLYLVVLFGKVHTYSNYDCELGIYIYIWVYSHYP